MTASLVYHSCGRTPLLLTLVSRCCTLDRGCYDFTVSVPVAAVRPGMLTLSFFHSYAHGHHALNGRTCTVRFSCHVTSDVSASRDSGPLTHMFPVSISRDSYCTCMCHGDSPGPFLCHAYVSLLTLLTRLRLCRLVSLPRLRYTHMFACRLVSFPCRFFLRPVFCPTSYPYPTGRYSCFVRLRPLRLFVLVSLRLVYILGWRWDDPHLQSTLQPP